MSILSQVMPVDRELFGRSRVRAAIRTEISAQRVDIPLLVAMGAAAALLTAFADLSLRIPGHKILLGVLPMSFGLAAAPRRRAGDVMALAAVLTAAALNVSGAAAMRWTAVMTIGLFGLALDLAARYARRGRFLYAAFAAAGLATNLVAFGLRLFEKLPGSGGGGGSGVRIGGGRRPFADWISVAPVSFAACGLLAGLIGAGLFFQFAGPKRAPRAKEPT